MAGDLQVSDAGTVVRLNGTTSWGVGAWRIGGEADGTVINDPGGTIENAGTLDILHDAATQQLGGGALANLAGGTINANANPTIDFPIANGGALNVTGGTLDAAVTQSAGTTAVTGTLGSIALNGGVLTGGGTISGLLDNAGGTVRPGSSPGTLTAGSFAQGAGGTLAVEVDGTSAFDVLNVTGTANLGGTVAVDRGFDPAPADVFEFLTAGTVNGTFATLTGGALPGGAAFALDYPASGDAVRLVVQLPQPPANTGQPTITPVAPVAGQTATCNPGTWTNSPAFAFRWLRDGQAIAGATGATYVVAKADEGHTLRCRVTGSNAGGSASALSNPVPVPFLIIDVFPTPTPTPAPKPTPAKKPPSATAAEKRLDRASPEKVAAAFGLPSARLCVSRRTFVVRLRRPRGVPIASAQVRVNKKRLRVRRVNGRFTARVDLRGSAKGRFTVRIRIRTTSERTLDGRRRYRTCASRK